MGSEVKPIRNKIGDSGSLRVIKALESGEIRWVKEESFAKWRYEDKEGKKWRRVLLEGDGQIIPCMCSI